MFTVQSFGAPMDGYESAFTQPDGNIITLTFYGDEFYARAETADGYTVIFDQETKTYFYAGLSSDGNAFVSTGAVVGKANPATLGIGKSLKRNPAARAAIARENHAKFEAVVKQDQRWNAVKEANRKYRDFRQQLKEQEKAGKQGFAIPMGTLFPDTEVSPSPEMSSPDQSGGEVSPSGDDDPSLAPPSFQLTGDVLGLTILVDFSDDVGTIAQKDVDDYCNKPGFNLWSNKGSIYDYFYIQSATRLRYNNNVTYYVRMPYPKSYYNDTSLDSGLCGRKLLRDALDVLIADGYDFSPLTTKSGGYIRAVNIYFAGGNSGVWAKGLWPHRWVLSPAKAVGGGKYVYDYQITNMGNSLTIGTFCHENGHMLLGYPDYYDYANDGTASRGMGSYTLMAYSGLSTNPHNIHGYLKWHSGWIDAIELYGAATPQRLAVRVDSDTIYKYTNPLNSKEYYMFENRAKFGWEANGNLPDTGLFITHNDEAGSRD
ncbi:MAG: M6 family metalloprotease domain-containing protein, partial [Kiritimatiellia bacterium]